MQIIGTLRYIIILVSTEYNNNNNTSNRNNNKTIKFPINSALPRTFSSNPHRFPSIKRVTIRFPGGYIICCYLKKWKSRQSQFFFSLGKNPDICLRFVCLEHTYIVCK